MIPEIGLMIGGYICFRCIELACRAKSSYSNAAAQTVVRLFAALGVLFTLFIMVSLILPGTGFPQFDTSVPSSEPRPSITCSDPHEKLGPSGNCWCEDGYKRDSTMRCVKQ